MSSIHPPIFLQPQIPTKTVTVAAIKLPQFYPQQFELQSDVNLQELFSYSRVVSLLPGVSVFEKTQHKSVNTNKTPALQISICAPTHKSPDYLYIMAYPVVYIVAQSSSSLAVYSTHSEGDIDDLFFCNPSDESVLLLHHSSAGNSPQLLRLSNTSLNPAHPHFTWTPLFALPQLSTRPDLFESFNPLTSPISLQGLSGLGKDERIVHFGPMDGMVVAVTSIGRLFVFDVTTLSPPATLRSTPPHPLADTEVVLRSVAQISGASLSTILFGFDHQIEKDSLVGDEIAQEKLREALGHLNEGQTAATGSSPPLRPLESRPVSHAAPTHTSSAQSLVKALHPAQPVPQPPPALLLFSSTLPLTDPLANTVYFSTHVESGLITNTDGRSHFLIQLPTSTQLALILTERACTSLADLLEAVEIRRKKGRNHAVRRSHVMKQNSQQREYSHSTADHKMLVESFTDVLNLSPYKHIPPCPAVLSASSLRSFFSDIEGLLPPRLQSSQTHPFPILLSDSESLNHKLLPKSAEESPTVPLHLPIPSLSKVFNTPDVTSSNLQWHLLHPLHPSSLFLLTFVSTTLTTLFRRRNADRLRFEQEVGLAEKAARQTAKEQQMDSRIVTLSKQQTDSPTSYLIQSSRSGIQQTLTPILSEQRTLSSSGTHSSVHTPKTQKIKAIPSLNKIELDASPTLLQFGFGDEQFSLSQSRGHLPKPSQQYLKKDTLETSQSLFHSFLFFASNISSYIYICLRVFCHALLLIQKEHGASAQSLQFSFTLIFARLVLFLQSFSTRECPFLNGEVDQMLLYLRCFDPLLGSFGYSIPMQTMAAHDVGDNPFETLLRPLLSSLHEIVQAPFPSFTLAPHSRLEFVRLLEFISDYHALEVTAQSITDDIKAIKRLSEDDQTTKDTSKGQQPSSDGLLVNFTHSLVNHESLPLHDTKAFSSLSVAQQDTILSALQMRTELFGRTVPQFEDYASIQLRTTKAHFDSLKREAIASGQPIQPSPSLAQITGLHLVKDRKSRHSEPNITSMAAFDLIGAHFSNTQKPLGLSPSSSFSYLASPLASPRPSTPPSSLQAHAQTEFVMINHPIQTPTKRESPTKRETPMLFTSEQEFRSLLPTQLLFHFHNTPHQLLSSIEDMTGLGLLRSIVSQSSSSKHPKWFEPKLSLSHFCLKEKEGHSTDVPLSISTILDVLQWKDIVNQQNLLQSLFDLQGSDFISDRQPPTVLPSSELDLYCQKCGSCHVFGTAIVPRLHSLLSPEWTPKPSPKQSAFAVPLTISVLSIIPLADHALPSLTCDLFLHSLLVHLYAQVDPCFIPTFVVLTALNILADLLTVSKGLRALEYNTKHDLLKSSYSAWTGQHPTKLDDIPITPKQQAPLSEFGLHLEQLLLGENKVDATADFPQHSPHSPSNYASDGASVSISSNAPQLVQISTDTGIGSVGTPTFAALSQMPVRSAQPQPSAEGAPSQSRFGWMEHPWTEPEFETQVEQKRKEQQTSFVTWVDAQFCRILDLFISQSASAFSEGRDDWVYTLKVIREDEADCIQMLLVSSQPNSDGTFSSSALHSAQRLSDLLNSWFGTQTTLQSDSRRRLWNQIVVTVRSWEAVCSENAQTMPLEIQQLLDDLSSHMPAQNSLSDFWTAFSLITNAQPDTLREFDPFSTFLSTTPQCHVQAQADSFLSSLRNTLHPV